MLGNINTRATWNQITAESRWGSSADRGELVPRLNEKGADYRDAIEMSL